MQKHARYQINPKNHRSNLQAKAHSVNKRFARKQDITTFQRDQWKACHLQDSKPLNMDLRRQVVYLRRHGD
jgi:hypothetical protein